MPAVAVIRRMRVLFSITGRKEYGWWFYNFFRNIFVLQKYINLYYKTLSIIQVYSIYKVKVKFENNVKTGKG